MSKKYWMAFAGASLAATNYLMVRLLSYEPRITRYEIEDPHWHGEKPLRLALVSDFHGGSGMWSGKALARIIRNEKVDATLVAGDHFDHKHDANNSFAFFEHLSKEVPTFFVTGNNEEQLEERDGLMYEMRTKGVHTLDNSAERLMLAGEPVTILGLPDVSAYDDRDDWVWAAQQVLKPVDEASNDCYHIVLAHRPEQYDFYNQLDGHLVFCGHAHGGQWQFPLIGGIFSPHQYLFPRYYQGVYKMGKKKPYFMVVGTGFDVHPLVPRINNRPELIILDIYKSELNA